MINGEELVLLYGRSVFKSCHPVVRRLKYARGVQSFHESRGISYTTAKDIIKDKLGVFFDDLSKLGTHSLRSGGASDSGCQILSDISCRKKVAPFQAQAVRCRAQNVIVYSNLNT